MQIHGRKGLKTVGAAQNSKIHYYVLDRPERDLVTSTVNKCVSELTSPFSLMSLLYLEKWNFPSFLLFSFIDLLFLRSFLLSLSSFCVWMLFPFPSAAVLSVLPWVPLHSFLPSSSTPLDSSTRTLLHCSPSWQFMQGRNKRKKQIQPQSRCKKSHKTSSWRKKLWLRQWFL